MSYRKQMEAIRGIGYGDCPIRRCYQNTQDCPDHPKECHVCEHYFRYLGNLRMREKEQMWNLLEKLCDKTKWI